MNDTKRPLQVRGEGIKKAKKPSLNELIITGPGGCPGEKKEKSQGKKPNGPVKIREGKLGGERKTKVHDAFNGFFKRRKNTL